jgi:hypothetical protein
LGSASPVGYGAGLLIGFYGLSATVIIPRFGAASFIAFILVAHFLRLPRLTNLVYSVWQNGQST